jgi:hypothetical protein
MLEVVLVALWLVTMAGFTYLMRHTLGTLERSNSQLSDALIRSHEALLDQIERTACIALCRDEPQRGDTYVGAVATNIMNGRPRRPDATPNPIPDPEDDIPDDSDELGGISPGLQKEPDHLVSDDELVNTSWS